MIQPLRYGDVLLQEGEDKALLLSVQQQYVLMILADRLSSFPASYYEDYIDYSLEEINDFNNELINKVIANVTIPPNVSPKYHNLFHVNSQNEAGGAVALTINTSQIMGHYAAQSPATVSDKFQSARFWLAADVPYVCTSYCVRGGGAGIVKLSLCRADDDTELASATQDLYAAASGFNFKVEFGHTPPDDVECYIRGEVTGKNASSSGYGVAITAFMVRS